MQRLNINKYYLIPLVLLPLELMQDVNLFSLSNLMRLITILLVFGLTLWLFRVRCTENSINLFQENASTYLMLITFALILCMAAISRNDVSVHPDEYSHVAVARYYYHHWLPPKIGAPETLTSYSVWGYSYITEFDIVYLVAGKFAIFINPLVGNDVIALRLFQVLLFAVLVSFCIVNKSMRWIVLPVLLTPQAWYVYSYFNADAMPLTVSLVLVCVLFQNGQSIFIVLNDERWKSSVVALSSLFVLLLLSKRNYLPIFAFILPMLLILINKLSAARVAFFSAGCALVIIGFAAGTSLAGQASQLTPIPVSVRKFLMIFGFLLSVFSIFVCNKPLNWFHDIRKLSFRFSLILAMTGLIVGARLLYDVSINGGFASRAMMINQMAEMLAGPAFKPSTYALSTAYPSMALAAHGVSIMQTLFEPWNWIQSSVNSFFGVYGYMSIFSRPYIYHVLIATFIALLFSVAAAILKLQKGVGVVVLISAFSVSFIIIISSFMLSWLTALQPQGRYLFPILPIFGVMTLMASADRKFAAFSTSLLIFGWSVSVYSFLFIGLSRVPH